MNQPGTPHCALGFEWRTALLICLSLVVIPFAVKVADCECDHEISPGTTTVNGTDLGVSPGDRICIMAGEYEFVRFQAIRGTHSGDGAIRGTESNPVVITNCNGLATIQNTDRACELVVEESSHHFHITGTGDPDTTYGFNISAPDKDTWPGVEL